MPVLRAGGGAGLGDAGLGVREGIKSRRNLENIIARVAYCHGHRAGIRGHDIDC